MKVEAAENILKIIRGHTDHLGLAFSAGKDSHVVADLASKIFPQVTGFYLFRIEGLKVIERLCLRAKRLWNMDVIHYPHFDLSRCYGNAILQPHWTALDEVPVIKFKDVEMRFRSETGIEWIAYGWRRSDSLSRALILVHNGGIDWENKRVYPIARWSRQDVLSYLRMKKIPRPPTFGRAEQGGVDFHPLAMAWIKENYPDDFEKIRKDFPYVEAQIIEAQRIATVRDGGSGKGSDSSGPGEPAGH